MDNMKVENNNYFLLMQILSTIIITLHCVISISQLKINKRVFKTTLLIIINMS